MIKFYYEAITFTSLFSKDISLHFKPIVIKREIQQLNIKYAEQE